MLYSAFLLGLISSFHCIGMCGPIAMMLPVAQSPPLKKILQIGTYHVGRIAAYAFFGLVFGMAGKGLYLAGLQQRLSIITGMAMIVVVLFPHFSSVRFPVPFSRSLSKARTALGKQFKKSTFKSFFLIGLLNGFLPCGMVYAALFGAISMGSITKSMLYMGLFGVGTIPLMTAVVYFKLAISLPFRHKVQKAVPYAVVCIGILFVLRGLSLGIPYISPADVSLAVMASPDCHH